MKTLKNIINILYFFSLSFAIVLGAMMHYFGNSYGKYILVISALFATYEVYKNDRD
jgi:hypothetical protein